MNNNQGNTPLTPAQRAALAEAREVEAQRRKYASSVSGTQNTRVQRPPQTRAGQSINQRPPIRQAQPAYKQAAQNQPNQRRINQDTREYPRAAVAKQVSNTQANQRYTSINQQQPQNKEDTGEYPSYVRATKKGGYRPAKVKQRHVTKIHRRKLDPHFKAVLFALGALLALFIILTLFGVRYSTVTLKADGGTVKFFGMAKDGEPYNGWLSYSTGEKGNLKNGNRIEYSDGSVYTGPTNDGLRTGQGTIKYKNGDKFEGTFSDNKKNGYGVMTYANGDKYEGNFVNDKREGSGTMTYADGSTYVGSYQNDRKNGYGVMTTIGESVYEGNYVDDIKNGYGVIVFANGDRYEGNFVNDMRNGHGIYYYYITGDIYEGNFKNSQFSGHGTYKWITGKEYTGLFENGQRVE